jgi:hypothetical protein
MNARTSAPAAASTGPGNSPAPSSDEPELSSEESVPSDGKDEVGEKMMEELGRERRQKD